MTLKAPTDNIREKIFEFFEPFRNPQSIDGLIIGNDLDSVISACYLKDKFGWNVVATYDYRLLWYSVNESDFFEKLSSGRYLAVDLDIYHQRIYSLGHHILEFNDNDKLPRHERTLNPNFIRGINIQSFWRKYPLGTIHFLLWLFAEKDLKRECELLIWLADSSYINGQSHKYRKNVEEWINGFLDLPLFQRMVKEIDTLEFESEIKQTILAQLGPCSICSPTGQIKSRHLGLSGFQCQWDDPNLKIQDIRDLFAIVYSLTGWAAPEFPSHSYSIIGTRRKISLNEMFERYGSLDKFLESNNVFSYVFPYNDSINFTTKINEQIRLIR